jgi:hypothetical protein
MKELAVFTRRPPTYRRAGGDPTAAVLVPTGEGGIGLPGRLRRAALIVCIGIIRSTDTM